LSQMWPLNTGLTVIYFLLNNGHTLIGRSQRWLANNYILIPPHFPSSRKNAFYWNLIKLVIEEKWYKQMSVMMENEEELIYNYLPINADSYQLMCAIKKKDYKQNW
jgi:hypothetical protein